MLVLDGAGLIYAALGAAALAAAVLPRFLGRLPVSMPMVFLAFGIAVFGLAPDLPSPDPRDHVLFTQHLTEACVIISLMGAGLALDRRISVRGWRVTWRLLGITMPLSILALVGLGAGVLGLGVASAILLGAALAPTDPVLSAVEVGPPGKDAASPGEGEDTDDNGDKPEDEEDEVRFALTSEAGLNDALAFPFVYAALAIAEFGLGPSEWLGAWVGVDVVWRIVAGAAVGVGAGWGLRKLFFSAPHEKARLAKYAEGFVALAATFLTYGAAEVVQGYGFLAVFVCAVTIRASNRDHEYHEVLHGYVEQLERLLTVVILLLLGGAIARGLLAGLGWREIVVTVVFLLVVRPVAGWAGLLRSQAPAEERAAISFFGVRGIATLFYLAYGLHEGSFAEADRLWALVGLVVAASVVLHGVADTPVMGWLDGRRRRTPDRVSTRA